MEKFILTTLSCTLFASATFATDAPVSVDERDGWKGSIEGGLDIYKGNTSSTDLYGKAAIAKEVDRWTHGGFVEAFNQEQSTVRTGEKYRAGLNTQYDFTERFFGFGEAEYVKDRFSGYDYRIHEDAGVGYVFLNDDKWFWDGRIGAGMQHTKDITGDKEDGWLVKTGTNLTYQFNDNVSFAQTAEALFTEELETYRSDSSVKSKISETLSFKAGYVVEKLSSVPAGRKKTDSHTYLGIVYDF